MSLNPAQHEAVHTLSGPLLVLAGAGTGKTRVVTFRIAELIRHGTRPSQILAVTFTKKAAGEMHQRAMALLGKRVGEKPEISTFHALCVKILRRHARRLGYPEKFAIYDRGDQESAARDALREIRVPSETLRPSDLLYRISRWKTGCVRPPEAAQAAVDDKDHLAAAAYRRYQQTLFQQGAMDFDDLLLCTQDLFARFKDVCAQEAARFRHLLIDEYQDTNGSQYEIVKALALPHRNLCVVGDDDQSIYGWRGAEVTHILQFKKDWPEAKVVRLEANYRSRAPILELANRLIVHNRLRHDKVLRPSRDGGEAPRIMSLGNEELEAKFVVREIRDLVVGRKANFKDVAILVRTNEQPRAFEQELRREKIPYVLIGGQSFYDRSEVRDILAYLKLLENPQDETSLRRIINKPARGIGASSVEALIAEAVSQGKPLWDILPTPAARARLTPAADKAVADFRRLVDSYRARLAAGESPTDVVAHLIHSIRYQDELARIHKEPREAMARWNSVEELINALAAHEREHSKTTLGEFIEETMLGARDEEPDKEKQLARNAVALMTLHSAKGLEFPHVYMVGMEEGFLPHQRTLAEFGDDVDEERRLCYVGVTRAQERLTLTLTLSRMKWGKPRPAVPSRFLFEMRGQADRARRPNAPRRSPADRG